MRKLWNQDGPAIGSAEWYRIQAGVDDVMRHITRSPNIPRTQSMIPEPQRGETPRAPSGGTTELKPPPGVRWCDVQMDADDERQRLEALIKQRDLVRALIDERAVKEPEPDPKAEKK